MGGCASRPKDSDFKSEAAPSELPASPKKAGGEDKHVAQVFFFFYKEPTLPFLSNFIFL